MSTSTTLATSRLRRHGVYMITGGRGGVGSAIAARLASQYKARLILISRRAVNHDPDSPDGRLLHRLRVAGGEALIFQADVADRQAMERVLGEAESAFGELHGVIHCAGVVDHALSKSALTTREEDFLLQAHPKIAGTQALLASLGERQLDFLALQSSLSSLLGGEGLTAYSAANGYLDTLAADLSRSASYPVLSLGWDGWRHSAASTDVNEDFFGDEEGGDAFVLALQADRAPLILVCKGDLNERIDFLRDLLLQTAGGSSDQRRGVGAPQAAHVQLDEIEMAVMEIWRDVLGIDVIRTREGFIDLGGSSLLAIRLTRRINEYFVIHLTLRQVLEAACIANQAALISQALLQDTASHHER